MSLWERTGKCWEADVLKSQFKHKSWLSYLELKMQPGLLSGTDVHSISGYRKRTVNKHTSAAMGAC